jgi:hypothetical protein
MVGAKGKHPMTDTPSNQQLTASGPKLADAELIILSSAANHADRIAIPVPESLSAKPDKVQHALGRLLRRKLLEEHPAKLEDGLWRKDDEDRHLTLRITPSGCEAIKIEMPDDLKAASPSDESMKKLPRRRSRQRAGS